MQVYKFRNFYLNTIERRVVKDGQYVELTPKAFDVLQLLIERPGEIVTKDEILGNVWNGSFVEEGNLPVHVSKLRRQLNESKTKPFIKTIPGSGYRFVSQVHKVDKGEWQKQLPNEDHAPESRRADTFTFDSVAVLPLQNESDDAEADYLADGITENFINNLSHISGLKVIARNTVFRYKDKNADAKEVGETLGVSAVLTGRIRIKKDNLLISVELIKVADNAHLWGTKFNQPFSDIFEVQERIILSVSEKLRAEISHVVGNLRSENLTHDSESYRLFLKGKYFAEKRSVENIYKAIEHFQRSISYDPTNILSYAGMVECYFMFFVFDHSSHENTVNKIKPLLSAMSDLNTSIDVVQAMYGGIKIYLDWEFDAAEKHLRAALAINPGCVVAHYRYAHLLMLTGRFSEALKELHQIMLIDPLSLLTYKRIGRLFYKMGQFENAVMYFEEAAEMEPGDFEVLLMLGSTLTELGDYDEALAIFNKADGTLRSDDSNKNELLSRIGCVYALSGKKEMTQQIIQNLKSKAYGNCANEIKLARIYACLNDKETALEYLETAVNQHDVDVIGLNVDPKLKPLRQEARFKELVKKVGIPTDRLPG